MINGNDLVRYFSEIEEGYDERLYSETDVDYIYEKAFSEGYEYAQREFGLLEAVKGGASKFSKAVKEGAGKVGKTFKEAASKGKKAVQEGVEQAENAIRGNESILDRTKRYIIENPYKSAAIGVGTVGVGAGGGYMIHRRRKNRRMQEDED